MAQIYDPRTGRYYDDRNRGHGGASHADLADFKDPQQMQHLVQERMGDFTEEMRRIEDAQARGEKVPDYPLLGLFHVPATFGIMINTVINPLLLVAAGGAHDYVGGFVEKYGAKVPALRDPKRLTMASRAAALTAGLGLQLADNVVQGVKSMGEYKDNLKQMAQDIAPVLDDLKGGHGLARLFSVSLQDNEVIYVQRHRFGVSHSRSHMRNLIGMTAKIPGVAVIAGKQLGFGKPQGADVSDALGAMGMKNEAMKTAMLTTAGGLAPVVEAYKQSLQREDARENGKTSAFSMIVSLAQRLQENPEADDFEVPGARNNQLSLAKYIAATFKCHQVDMAKLDPQGSRQIRQKHEQDLLSVADVIAESIRKGDISPLTLIHLVGERQIVRHGGADVVKVEDVPKILRQYTGDMHKYVKVDEKQFFENMNMQDIKDALAHLKGPERLMFMSTLPDNILKAVGVKDKEIEDMRSATASHYREELAEMTLGLDAHDDGKLKELGLGKEQISVLRDAAQAVKDQGVDGIDQYRTSAIRSAGVENPLQEIMLESVRTKNPVSFTQIAKGGKDALAKMAAEGRERLDAETEGLAEGGRHSRQIARERANEMADERGID